MGKLHEPEELAATIRGRESVSAAYCWGVWILDGQRLPTLGGLQGTDVGTPHWPRQVSLGQASRRGIDLL